MVPYEWTSISRTISTFVLTDFLFQLRLSVFSCLICFCLGQYGPQYVRPPVREDHQAQAQHTAPARHYAPDPYIANKPLTPPPLIISHKQALTHDGGFNFAFAADNGLQQGESIAPDGTRKGGYSYIDPHGKKITVRNQKKIKTWLHINYYYHQVRYTAGKDGFRIVEGDHLPKASYPVGEPAPYQQQPQQQYSAPQTYSSGHGLLYRRPSPPEDDGQYRPQESYHRPQQYTHTTQPPKYQYKVQSPQTNALQQEPDYHDEPGKPHSFGAGYAFQFSG